MNRRWSHAPDLDRMVAEIYSGVADTGRFERSALVVATALKSHLTGLRTENIQSLRTEFLTLDESGGNTYDSVAEDYGKRWAGKNLWMERSVSGYLSKGYEVGENVVTDRELRDSEYFRVVCRPLDIRHGAGICLWHDNKETFSLIGINRRASVGALGAHEINIVENLRPHLANAYSIYRRIALSDRYAGTFRSCFNRTSVGMIVLDEEGRILDANDAAEHLMASGIGICRNVDGHARVSGDFGALHWRRALKRLQSKEATGGWETILLGTAAEQLSKRVLLRLCALPRVSGDFLVSRGRLLVFLSPLEKPQIGEAECKLLQSILGLTSMEAKVVILLRGFCDSQEVAARLHVKTSTVRTHTRNIFLKLGIRRQSELVLLAERLLASLPTRA